jgi:hypothetical protein
MIPNIFDDDGPSPSPNNIPPRRGSVLFKPGGGSEYVSADEGHWLVTLNAYDNGEYMGWVPWYEAVHDDPIYPD